MFLNKSTIASVSGIRPDQWNRYPSQISAPVYLEAGAGHYLEVLPRKPGR